MSTTILVTGVGKSVNETSHIENVVLGGGEAGKYIAWEPARHGRPVVVIERTLIGGSCPNVACLPSKNVIRSAKVADLAHRGSAYGVRSESVVADMEECVEALKHDGPALVEVLVNRQELALPPSIEVGQMIGFSLYMIKAVLNGRGDEIIDLAKSSLFR